MESQRQVNLHIQGDRQSTRCSTGPNEETRQLNQHDATTNNQQVYSQQSHQPILADIVFLPSNNQITQTEPQIHDDSPQNNNEQHHLHHQILPPKPQEQDSKEDYDADDEASHPSYPATSSIPSNAELQQPNNIVQPSRSEDEQSNLIDSHKDEQNYSQETNLLNFGFSIQEPMVIENPKEVLQPIPQNQQENIPIQPNPKVSQQFHTCPPSQQHNQMPQPADPKYKVEVITCADPNNQLVKNNDIYSSNHHQSTTPQHQTQTFVKQQQNQHQTRKQQQISHDPEPEQPSLIKIIASIKDLLRSDQQDDQGKFRIAMNILEDHIDHTFLRHITPIGQAFLTDGQLATLYIQAAILRQPTLQYRKILQKYMLASLSSKIQVNKQAFQRYRHQETASSEKNQTSHSQQTQQQQSHYHYNDSEVGNASVQAQDGSHLKSNKNNTNITKNMEIDNPDNRPVKRTVLLVNRSANTTQLLSPRMGKATRRKQNASSNAQQSQTGQPKSKNILAQGRSKAIKSQIKKIDHTQQNQHLGSGYTYAALVDRKKSQKILVQVRRSERLLAKQVRERPEDQYRPESIKKQTKRSARKSLANKSLYTLIDSAEKRRESDNEEQQQNRSLLKVDYLKQHFKEIVVNVSMMERDYPAHTENDRKITQLLHELEKQQQSSRNLVEQGVLPPLSQVEENYNEPDPQENAESTATLAFDPSQDPKAIEARRRQFKKQLHKYALHEAVVKKIIDCDINGHGIYALFQLAPISQLLHGAKYALTPITNLQYANRRNIQKDIETAKEKVGNERQNIAFVQLNSNILKMIEKEALKLNNKSLPST